MQSIFRLPWCGEHLSPKLADKVALDSMRPSPVVELPVFGKFKRKRSGSPEPASLAQLPVNKRQRPDLACVPSTTPYATNGGVLAKPASQQTLPPPPAAQAVAPARSTNFSVAPPVTTPFGLARATDGLPTLSCDKPSNNSQRGSQKSSARAIHISSSAETKPATAKASQMTDATMTTHLEEVIGNQFNAQILLKHQELRLIEQELAKCQIALEQLRRCELRSFPGNSCPSANVTSGSGPAVTPKPGYTRPSHPSPFGVTDGAYTRHYQQWLIPDPQFDSVSELALAYLESSANAAGRPTRNCGSAGKYGSHSVSYPARSTETLQSIPNYPAAQPKDKSSPLVLKRSTDGRLVKLVCNNCHRGNFSSIQGFLNHCRIAHKVDLKSHDEAAIKCGQPMDDNEMASLPSTTVNTPVAKPAPTRTASTSVATPCRTSVHPFNGPGNVPTFSVAPRQPSGHAPTPIPSLTSAAASVSSSPFTPDGHLPHLSAHFAKHKFGGDLAKAVAMAKQTVDFPVEDELLSPDSVDLDSPLHAVSMSHFLSGTSRVGLTGSNESGQRPPSRKGFRQPAINRPRPSPLAPTEIRGAGQLAQGSLESPQCTPTHLSPHTVDSNPGLVSDHDDDDQGSASEEDSPGVSAMHHPLPSVTRSCADNMDLVVEECHDLDRRSGVLIRRNSLGSEDVRAAVHDAAATARQPPSRKFGGGDEQ